MAKIIGNTTATPSPIGNLSNLKTKNKNSLVDAINEAAESANGDCVSYLETQALTDKQKEIARNNIGAVDASLVTDNVDNGNKIPNGNGLSNFIRDNIHNYPVVLNDRKQFFTDVEKAQARTNIGAISQAELDEAIANAGGGGGDFISYTETQDLTDEQKEIARNNINAFNSALVVSRLGANNHVPNAAALIDYFENDMHRHPVVSCAESQEGYLTDEQRKIARTNIGAVSQAELDEAIANAGSSGDFISYSEAQALTDEQKEIARNNIDATGIYIGSGDMPEGYDIQIDTDGDVYSITNRITDDTNTEIPNCEAVKDYIANNITIADDGNGNITLNSSSNKVEFTDDGNGNIKMEVM